MSFMMSIDNIKTPLYTGAQKVLVHNVNMKLLLQGIMDIDNSPHVILSVLIFKLGLKSDRN